jgi:hypothetical protein
VLSVSVFYMYKLSICTYIISTFPPMPIICNILLRKWLFNLALYKQQNNAVWLFFPPLYCLMSSPHYTIFSCFFCSYLTFYFFCSLLLLFNLSLHNIHALLLGVLIFNKKKKKTRNFLNNDFRRLNLEWYIICMRLFIYEKKARQGIHNHEVYYINIYWKT